VALWCQYPEPSLQQSYQLIQAYLLLTQFYFRKFTEKEGKNYQSTTRESTRLIRQFADTAKPTTILALRPLLALMPAEPVLMEEFLEELREMEDDDEEEGDALVANVFKKNLAVLRRMLEYAAEHRGGYSRRNNRSWDAILKREAIRIPIISNDPDAQPVDFSIETLLMPSQTMVIENAARRAGCAPGEVKTGVEHFIYSENPNQPGTPPTYMAGRSPLAHIRRTRDKHHAVAMSNQLLPTQWGRLTLQELTLFLSSVSNLVREDRSKIKVSYSDRISNKQLAALLTAIYWTSNDLPTVCQYRFCKTRNDLPKATSLEPNDFRFVIGSEEWAHGSLRPNYKSLLKAESKPYIYDTYSYVILPIRNGTAHILQQYLITRNDETKKKRHSKKIFEHDLEDYQVAVSAFLASLNRKYKIRLTKTRIANDLFQRLHQTSGDIVEAMLITGREHYLGTVPLHYSSPTHLRLQRVYTQTCQHISNAVYQSLEKPVKPAKVNALQLPEQHSSKQYTGGRHYLQKGSVAKLVEGEFGLVQRFNKCLKFAGFNDYWVNLHNDYTLYVAEMLGFATGYRAVRDPLDSLTQIDWLTGFACISDKDDLDYYNARLVWLPPLVCQQIRHYQYHCQCLGERLILINPEVAKNLLNHGVSIEQNAETNRANRTDKKTNKNSKVEKDRPPFLFLLNTNGRLLNLRPAEITERLRAVFPVPVNVNRSYLRNRLREHDCPGELVNYFLGHWENGEEPFGPYATLSPFEYKQTIAPLLEQILEEDGWCAIVGFGHT